MRSPASPDTPSASRPGWARPARGLLCGLVAAAAVVLLPGTGRASAAVESYSPVQRFVAEEANYQTWTVPPGIDEITLYVDGGMGGDGDLNGGEGGYGGGVRANFAVSGGETLEIAVGNKGPSGYSAEAEQIGGSKELAYFGGGGALFTFFGGGPGAEGVNTASEEEKKYRSIGGGGAGGGCSEVILHDGSESTLLVIAPGGGGGGGGNKSGTKGGNGGGGGEAGKPGSTSSLDE